MVALKLTKRSVEAAPVTGGRDTYFWDTELKGFGLRVTPRSVRSYVLQYRMSGRPARRMTIGIHGSPWTADQARSHAAEILYDVKRGIDPVEAARKRQRAAIELEFSRYVVTFTEGYLKLEWRDSWWDAMRQLELHVVPYLKGRPLCEIEKHETAAVIAKLRGRPALARNTHAVLRKLFSWAVDQGDLQVSPICSAPPPVKARKRILSPDELIALWRSSISLGWPMGQFIRMLIITLQRRSEVAALPWHELCQKSGNWYLDGDRVKNDEDHLVPLSPMACAVLNEMAAGPKHISDKPEVGWRRSGLIFTTTGKTPISGFSKVKKRLDELMLGHLQHLSDDRADARGEAHEKVTLASWRLHDIRRTGTTQMQALGIPIEVTEKVINHKSGETAGIRGVYNLYAYNDERARALAAWAAYLEKLVAQSDPSIAVISSVGDQS